ncbi:MAG TPA: MmcQ/YjbR family DNA-binding protein [Chitinophagaceae bacterium]|nr:MmcQ/YjbR family DNA-binding protein [Chitinophagaceae bacterium]
MDAESIRHYCLLKKGTTEGFPFGPGTLVFKVMERMYLLVALDASPLTFNAKCDPDEASELRDRYTSINPGYHMNKKLWNTVIIDGSIPNQLLRKMIDDSYDLIVRSLPKKAQQQLQSA